jgi:hypothetical protein
MVRAPGEPHRRWFRDDFFDLVVWYESDEILGFQLCYDRLGREHAITWFPDRGFSHDRIDTGDEFPTKTLAPMLVPVTPDSFAHTQIVSRFEAATLSMDPAVRGFVLARLRG